MKKQLLIILAIVPFSLSSMDIELKSFEKQEKLEITSANVEEIVQAIDTAINKQYPQTIGSFFTRKTEADQVNILRVPQTYSPPIKINNLLIEKLISKNTKFSDALAYFSDIKNITCHSLPLLEDSEQAITSDNKFPTSIRSYLRKSLQGRSNHPCNITIQQESKIKLCDICCEQDWAATYHENDKLYLWDLKTGKNIFRTTLIPNLTALAFDPRASHLYIGKGYNQPIIQVVSIPSKSIIYEFNCCDGNNHKIKNIKIYNIQSNLTLLSVYVQSWYRTSQGIKETKKMFVNQWILNDKKYLYAGTIDSLDEYYQAPAKIIRGCYKADNLRGLFSYPSLLMIVKENCFDFCICEQATKTITQKKDALKITSSQSYKNLIKGGYEYEKNMIDKQIIAKTQELDFF